MTIEEIKKAVEEGKAVYWKNPAYSIYKEEFGFRVKCSFNNHIVSLGCIDPSECYVEEK